VIVLSRIAALLGWRGGAGLVAGAVFAIAPAYQLGKIIEAEACDERVERTVAQHDIRRMERENDLIAEAQAARARARTDRARSPGGVPDDGFRRD
jgi:hypothetical protein